MGCAVTLCLSGIMFDSPFLSDGSTPLRGVVLSYFSLSVIIFSILYFVLAFLFEIKQSKVKKKTKRQVLWSKLKGMKHKIVEDAKNEQKASKLQGLLSKSSKVNKVSPFNIKQMQSIIPKSSVANGRRLRSDSIERKLNKSSSSSLSDNSSSESGISSISDNASLVDLLSGDSSEQNSSDGRSGDTKESSSSSSGSTSSAAVSSSDKSDSEVSYMPPSSSENEESSELEHESEGSNTSSESNMAAGDSDSDIEMVDNTSSSSNE